MTETRMVVGRYRLDSAIGHGATGAVSRAYDEVLRRWVAIKEVRLPSGMPPAEAEQLTTRTLHEARAIAALTHPHVITLYDIVLLDTGPVIVMELMDARSLAEQIRDDGPMSDTTAAIVGEAVASGLIAAHAAGITHRDIKPANVLIGYDGRIKLTDFGIARSVGEQSLTATGLLLGSPAYISPEVAAGQSAQASADAWGLGATLFAAVEGHPPVDKGDAIATLTAVVHDPIPPHRHAGALGPIIDALLVKDPAERLGVTEAHRLLADMAAGAELPTASPSRGRDMRQGMSPSQEPYAPAQHAPEGFGGERFSPEQTRPETFGPGTRRQSTTTEGQDASTSAGEGIASYPQQRPAEVPLPAGFARAANPAEPSLVARAELPPPPWAPEAAAALAPLPTDDATPPNSSRARPRWVWVAAIVVGIIAVAAGLTEVLALAHWG